MPASAEFIAFIRQWEAFKLAGDEEQAKALAKAYKKKVFAEPEEKRPKTRFQREEVV